GEAGPPAPPSQAPEPLTCRSCDAPLERTVIDLGLSPLANSYVTARQRRHPQPFYPLHPRICDACELVQVPELVSAESIFSDYAYFSSYSSSWIRHCAEWSEEAITRFGLTADSLVVEVASNDGYMLKNFVQADIPCLGIEPARNVAEAATTAGVPTRVDFFGERVAQDVVLTQGRADLVMALNVLAHVPDINDFVAGLSHLLSPTGVLHLEVPHLLGLLQGGLFDTIYHEHFSYLSVTSLKGILLRSGLQMFQIEERATHGASLRVLVRHIGQDQGSLCPSVGRWLEDEANYGITSTTRHEELRDRAHQVRADLLNFLMKARREGRKVVGYGAPAKGNTLLNWCGIGPDLLAFTADINPVKQGTWLPGTDIPVRSPEALIQAQPDHVLVLPWNLRDEIEAQLSEIRSW
ncbi:MAG: class I SAM-dependent methyltransferase, partial [Myxococcota bacterium]|nr:class I SAM-dependent methyltransferase [Myxococcota bacterium]